MEEKQTNFEIVPVSGISVSLQHKGKYNCRVNLTQMAKPFGESKKPVRWLWLEETKTYLELAGQKINSQRPDMAFGENTGNEEPIIIRKGGKPGYAGTWCTYYHIAIEFARWLSPAFGWAVADGLINLFNGNFLLNNTNGLQFGGRLSAVYCFKSDTDAIATFKQKSITAKQVLR